MRRQPSPHPPWSGLRASATRIAAKDTVSTQLSRAGATTSGSGSLAGGAKLALHHGPAGGTALRELLRGLLDLLLAPTCPACDGAQGAGPAGLCARCLGALASAPARLPAPRGVDALVAAAEYRGPVEGWIRRFKYPHPGLAGLDPRAGADARALALAAAARAPGPPPELVVPVPSHPRRLRARGFNPASELARAIAGPARLRLGPCALERVRDTPTQAGQGRAARRRNLRGAFRARGAVPARIWLVDDVVTTGSTLGEAARALRRAGARRIVAICAAATPAR
jgi:predicted amidophosphoribosyltransferase